jgi:hypothetical protein
MDKEIDKQDEPSFSGRNWAKNDRVAGAKDGAAQQG